MKNPVDLFRKITNISTCIMLMSLQSTNNDVKNNDDNVYETNVKYEVRLDDFPPETELTKYTPFYRPNSIAGRPPLILKYVNTLQEVFGIIFNHPNGKKYYLFPSEACKEKAREEFKKGYNTCYRTKDPFAIGDKNHIMTVYKAKYE